MGQIVRSRRLLDAYENAFYVAVLVVTVVLLVVLAGCQTTGLTSSFCDPRSGIEPFRTTVEERAVLSQDVKRNMLRINSYGSANCNWKP